MKSYNPCCVANCFLYLRIYLENAPGQVFKTILLLRVLNNVLRLVHGGGVPLPPIWL